MYSDMPYAGAICIDTSYSAVLSDGVEYVGSYVVLENRASGALYDGVECIGSYVVLEKQASDVVLRSSSWSLDHSLSTAATG